MTDQDIPRYAALLKQLYILRELNEAQIASLVNRLGRVEYPANAAIQEAGQEGNSFYFVFSGKVRLSLPDGQVERTAGVIGSGDYFGEEALLSNRRNPFTVIAVSEQVVVLRLSEEDFLSLLEEHPQIRKDLQTTIDSRQLAERKNFDWLGEEEVVTMIVRKHFFFFLRSLLLPLLLAALSLFGLSYGLTNPDVSYANITVVLSMIGLFASAFIGVWNYINWENDYYILTTQRVVWLERVIILYYSRREAPLTQILAVNVVSSFFGRLIGYGNVEVRTYTGSIRMKNASQPNRFAAYIEKAMTLSKEAQKKYEADNKDMLLRQRLETGTREAPETQAPPPVDSAATQKAARPNLLRQTLDTFMQVRFVQGAVVTYRKHWMLLLKASLLPLLAFLGLLILGTILIQNGIVAGSCLYSLFVLSLIGVFLWWLYVYLDWSNDIYQLTPDQILDVKRKPLGEEIKKTAPLESILSLEHAREGIIQLIFNYGNVIINIGEAKFIFTGVKNPDEVQQEIAANIEALRRRKQEQESMRERENMLDWLSTYHRQSEKIEEVEKKTDWDLFPG